MQLPVTFVLLAFSIVSVWVPAIRVGDRVKVPIWPLLYVAAILSGLYARYIELPAVIVIAVFAIAAFFAARAQADLAIRIGGGAVVVIIGLALAFHLAPGFNNPILIKNEQLSVGASPYTQYANFDKATVGLLILALLCKRAATWEEWKNLFQKSYGVVLAAPVIASGLAVLVGYVHFAPKAPPFTGTFLAVNLLFVCVAEETFFRGFLQDRLAGFLAERHLPWAGLIAIIVCALLYGLMHLGAGPIFVLLTVVAGLGYGYAYYRTQRVEAAILAHFVLNAVHFLGFTYPKLA